MSGKTGLSSQRAFIQHLIHEVTRIVDKLGDPAMRLTLDEIQDFEKALILGHASNLRRVSNLSERTLLRPEVLIGEERE